MNANEWIFTILGGGAVGLLWNISRRLDEIVAILKSQNSNRDTTE